MLPSTTGLLSPRSAPLPLRKRVCAASPRSNFAFSLFDCSQPYPWYFVSARPHLELSVRPHSARLPPSRVGPPLRHGAPQAPPGVSPVGYDWRTQAAAED